MRAMPFALTAALLTATLPAQADLWSGFYTPSRPTVPAAPVGQTGCLAAILDAQARYDIPDNLLLAIGIQEAGRQVDGDITVWPWAVNAEGKGIFFKSRAQAIGWVRTQLAQGMRSIDVGCMQINLRWHQGAFASLEQAFDPEANADYAARFLTDLKHSEGTWWRAAGAYHSRTDDHRRRYLAALKRNHAVANAEFARISALARGSGPRLAEAQTQTLPAPPVLWGDAADAESAFSIYSRHPLSPVLPAFQEAF